MGQSKSKINLHNKCDCHINQKIQLYPNELKTNNGLNYIYFPIKKILSNEDNSISFSWFTNNNVLMKDYTILNIKKTNFIKVKINKKSFLECKLTTDKNNIVKFRVNSKKKYLVFICPVD